MLDDLNGGHQGAFDELVDAVYADIRAIAAKRMAQHFDRRLEGLTVQPTAIANDAIMEIRRQRAEWQNTEQFFAIAARLVNRLVLQYQRDRMVAKRGGGKRGAALPSDVGSPSSDDAMLSADALEALERLTEVKPRVAEVVTLTSVCGKTVPAAAAMVGVSVPQAERDRRFGLAWLRSELAAESEENSDQV